MNFTNLITAPTPLPLMSKLNPAIEGSLATSTIDLKNFETKSFCDSKISFAFAILEI